MTFYGALTFSQALAILIAVADATGQATDDRSGWQPGLVVEPLLVRRSRR